MVCEYGVSKPRRLKVNCSVTQSGEGKIDKEKRIQMT
jgi:hypothetical protein